MSGHTPGPWTVESLSEYGDVQVFSREHGYVADLTAGSAQEIKRNQSNAVLIAAAPDMLEALERTVEMYEEEAPIMAADLKAVIAKAKGQENGG